MPVSSEQPPGDRLAGWLHALEARHLHQLTFAEVTRALRALSSAYVERRAAGAPRAALDSAGKRAAFALFYAPLHFVAVTCVVNALGAELAAKAQITDMGCGTGVAGAAWAMASGSLPRIVGLDRHPWAVQEARWTYAQLGVIGRAQSVALPRPLHASPGDAVVAAYVLNEMSDPERTSVEQTLARLAADRVRVLVLEPIARHATPWWTGAAARLAVAGFRADQWRFAIERPAIVRKLDESSGLDHRTISVRTLYHPGEASG